MALFPEKVNGKYVMISRQGGENINIMFSEDLYRWEEFQILMEPRFTWELLQLGQLRVPDKNGERMVVADAWRGCHAQICDQCDFT